MIYIGTTKAYIGITTYLSCVFKLKINLNVRVNYKFKILMKKKAPIPPPTHDFAMHPGAYIQGFAVMML